MGNQQHQHSSNKYLSEYYKLMYFGDKALDLKELKLMMVINC